MKTRLVDENGLFNEKAGQVGRKVREALRPIIKEYLQTTDRSDLEFVIEAAKNLEISMQSALAVGSKDGNRDV